MTTADEYHYERGRLEQYRATVYQRMTCATPAGKKQIIDEGEALAAHLDQLADRVRAEGEAARNAALPSAEERYDVAIRVVRCTVFPPSWWLLQPTTAAADQVAELQRIEARWNNATGPRERAVTAAQAEGLARRMRNNSIIDVKPPGAVLDEMNTTSAIIEQLGRDIDSSRTDERFKSAWRLFRDDWRRFYVEHKGWTDRLWYSSYEKTVEYRRRAADWRSDFEARGGHASGPKDTPPSVPGEFFKDIKDLPWKKIAIGAGVGVGALVGLNLLIGRR